MTNIDVITGSNLYTLIGDFMLFDFIYKVVVIFGVGYMVARGMFKR